MTGIFLGIRYENNNGNSNSNELITLMKRRYENNNGNSNSN